MKPTTFILALLCSLFSNSQPKQLQPGDTIPAAILNSLTTLQNPARHCEEQSSSIKHPKSSPSLRGTKQKNPASPLINTSANYQIGTLPNQLIILDFFTTWCTSCYRKFPLLDSLQQHFNGQLQVILVPSNKIDDEKRITAFFQKRKKPTGESWPFSVAIGDTILEQYFPHRVIPHYVWIYKGRVTAITSSESLNAENIQAILNGDPLTPPLKSDSIKSNSPGYPGTKVNWQIDKSANQHITKLPTCNEPATTYIHRIHTAIPSIVATLCPSLHPLQLPGHHHCLQNPSPLLGLSQQDQLQPGASPISEKHSLNTLSFLALRSPANRLLHQSTPIHS